MLRRLTIGVLALAALSAEGEVRLKRQAGGVLIYNSPARRASHPNHLQWLAQRHDRRSKFDASIERYAQQFGVDPVLVRAVIQVESDFNPNCVSNKGARGLMQLMPATAARFGVRAVHDPDENIRGGVHYLRVLLRMFNGDLTRTLAAYNAGENAVKKYGGVPPYAETKEYVRRALTVYHGRPHGTSAISFAGRKGGRLHGGFGQGSISASVLPPLKILGTLR